MILCLNCRAALTPHDGYGDHDDYGSGGFSFSERKAFVVYEDVGAELVKAAKTNGRPDIAWGLGKLMASHMDLSAFSGADAVVPAPADIERYMKRQFNQSEVMASAVAKALKIPLISNALVKIRTTKKQGFSTGAERRQNLTAAFAVKHRDKIRGTRILLIDDVYTTGATVYECGKTLSEAGAADVMCLTFAKTEKIFPNLEG
jgi:ComF family protein